MHELTETIRGTARDLAGAPLQDVEIARLAPRLAELLAALHALDEMGLEEAEPFFTGE